MALTPGTKLGPYEIQSPLGAGGMGEVYRATDTKLGRDIALKVLPAEMAQDPERLGRFRREAKALAQLDHPNIVTIHSVEECAGIHFLTMQLVEGQPLDRLICAGGLPIEQIVEIASALGDALAAAHEKGIVHRDLKPANVMVSNEGRVKVLDFGLAKDVRGSTLGDATMTSASRTEVGVVMGTPAYMSPEQTSGRPLDHRTDIFSLGVLLHEMATGRRPFEGASSAELVSAILRDTPPPVTDVRPDLPSDLARIVRRCLEKDPRHRLQTARDVSNEFRDLARQTSQKAMSATTSTTRTVTASDSGRVRTDEGFWVAVLPFKYTGANAELIALAEGLSEEIVTGLSRFSYLRVIARGSTAKYSSESGDVRAIGKELGARYVMEGSLRQAGTKLRLAVQLVEATTGSHLWAETYDRSFKADAVFELQDELVPRIISTAADRHGALPHSISEAVRAKNPEQLTPYEAVLLSFSYAERLVSDEQFAAKACLQRAVTQAPGYADAWAMLAMVCCDEYTMGLKPEFSLLERALEAAQRAVKAGPSNHLAYQNLAYAHFLRREHGPCRNAAERGLALNSMDASNVWFMGLLMAYMGDWERGCALVDQAMHLNPNFPGKYRFPLVANAYRKGDYRGALNEALRINMPDVFYSPLLVAVAAGQLDESKIAEKALHELLLLKPDIATIARENLGKWFQPDLVEHLIEGLHKAGLEIPEAGVTAGQTAPAAVAASSAALSSGATRSEEGFWVAVLPFKSTAASAELKALADGISEEVVAGLSRFSYLRVITSGSTQRYLDQSPDLRTVGKELGARYVMSGNLRQVGIRLRVAAQLVDAATGAQLWSETYERPFNVETVFELQDDLAARIAATVGDAHGILAHSMSEALRDKAPNQLTPYEAVLRSFGYGYRQTPEEHAAVRDALELAVERAPNNADAWSMLSRLYMDEFAHGTNLRPDALNRMLHAARRAVDAAPTSAMAYGGLAYAMFFRKEFQAFRTAADQSIALNPLNSPTVAGLGALMAYTGEWERGCALVERAMQLNPRHPGWYWIPLYCNAYRKGDYRGAVNFAIKFNLPGFHVMHEALAAAYGQLGEREKAAESLREIFRLKPDYVTSVLERLEKWFDPEFVSHMLDGLRKAGLNIPEDRKQTLSGPVPAAPSIAVLPFANMSDDKEQDYFSDGLAEEIINLLAQIPALKVIARTSAFAFRGKEQDIRGIAEALGVNTVLEGSVRRSGSRIRVTAQLINAADGSHLWSERYDRELRDIFAVQDEISAAIAKALRVKLSHEAAPERYTPKLEAYEAYLKGRYHQAKVTPESMELARRFYEQASELDPAFAMPHVGLAFYWHCLAHFGRHFARDCVSPARAEARQALQIDPSLPEAHAFLGYIAAMYDLNWAAAERHFDSPGAKEVGFGLLRPLYAWVEFWRGNVEPAIKLAERAIEEDPLEVWTRMNLHAYLQAAGRDDEALEQLKKVLELDENLVLAQVSMAMIYADKGDLPEALKIARRAYAVGPWSPDPIGVLAGLTRRNGEEVDSSLLQALGSGETPGDARAHALYHLLCGELDPGADWVERAIEQRDASMMVYLRFVVCKGLRASRRWPKIARMINLPL
jgi:TolB-like protein/Tfp pilus assembly protein PilF